jgi:6-phosphogluconolactonase
MEPKTGVRFELIGDAEAVAHAAARSMLRCAARSISDRGRFRIVLGGGTTPLAAYRILAREAAGWESWEVYFGDERCLPRDHPERNSLSAREALLDRVPLPRDRVFTIPAEMGPTPAAVEYAATVAEALPFDMVLLGMGEDGHTASLFPGHAIGDGELVVPVFDAPKPPPDRVSLSLGALASCREMLILVTGAGKRAALAAWRGGADLPVARVAAAAGARVLLDRDAAGEWEPVMPLD